MINFAALEESIQACAEQQTDMSSSLRRLETTVATLASKMEVDQMEHRLKDSLSKTSRSIERLDVEQQAAQQVVQDMPSIQRELTTRMSDLEQRLTADVAKLSQSLGARVSAAEGDLRNKAGKADMSKLKTDIEDCVRRESFDKMQALLNKVRDEASDRLDGIAERTFNMRKELDSSLDQMTATSELLQKRVEERSAALEDQANEVSTFLAKAERQIGSKVSNDELTRVTKAFAEQLQETRNVLQAQMDVVRGRAERSTEDFQQVVDKMDAVAMRAEMTPIAEEVKKLEAEISEMQAEMPLKATADEVAQRIDEIVAAASETKDLLLTKADAINVQERHERHVQESTSALNGLREVTEHLGISINSVEESVNLVAAQTGTKAETRDVHEMMRMNEGVQTQVAALKSELQGTLKALETWILEQNTKKTHGMRLQPKPADGVPQSATSSRPTGGAATRPPPSAMSNAESQPPTGSASSPPGARPPPLPSSFGGAPSPPQSAMPLAAAPSSDDKLQQRVTELERQLAETQALLYASGAAPPGFRGVGDGPFVGGFGAPTGVPNATVFGASKLDATGSFLMPSGGDAAAGYGGQGLTPRPPPRAAGGVHAAGGTHAASGGMYAAGGMYAEGGGDGVGPPFRSQSVRRQWLLQEKRRWLVEMRLGGPGAPDGGAAQTAVPGKLPPIPAAGGATLSTGVDVATLATPR